ncbi:MAG: hypothetical protein AAF988_07635 [Pseudomonadota bacterium]
MFKIGIRSLSAVFCFVASVTVADAITIHPGDVVPATQEIPNLKICKENLKKPDVQAGQELGGHKLTEKEAAFFNDEKKSRISEHCLTS